MANGCIPKPTFWTFVFYKKLKEFSGKCVYRDDDCVVIQTDSGEYRGVAWHMTLTRGACDKIITYRLEAHAEEYCLITKTVDEEGTNPLKVWHDMGEPANLTKEQTELLKSAANPCTRTERKKAAGGEIVHSFTLPENAVVYFELKEIHPVSDRGYSYERVMQ